MCECVIKPEIASKVYFVSWLIEDKTNMISSKARSNGYSRKNIS